RIREITNTLNGVTFKDHSEMDVLTEADLIGLLTPYGFKHVRTYYDYLSDKSQGVKRMQLLFVKSD
ncbi:MAG TPA: hypothetical protein VFM05_04315, partial [Candidatus Saccharimonadales bacterium]|nr:hypothetical protein [Candidatus Saccharimonadales bacterium]